MREKDLPIDLTKHKVYSKNAKKCVQKLLRRYYGKQTAAELFAKEDSLFRRMTQLQNASAGWSI